MPFLPAMNRDRNEKISRRIVLALARTMFLFGLPTWGYVVAMQLRNTRLVYDTLAEWVPTRMDHVGETAFILSMAAYFRLKFFGNEKWYSPLEYFSSGKPRSK
jgi:hypothetical protein